jgi:eukaryotic translation initiation factor 2C
LGNGLRLWQGYFQSVRAAGNRVMINVDITTGVVFEGGPLIHLCLKHLKKHVNDYNALIPESAGGSLDDRARLRLQRFTYGLRISVSNTTGKPTNPRVVRKFSSRGASSEYLGSDSSETVAQYFHRTLGRPLKFPNMICVQVSNTSKIMYSSISAPTAGRERCIVSSGVMRRLERPTRATTGAS